MEYTEIKSFEDACNAKGISTELPDVSALPELLRKKTIANYQLDIVASAINPPDWSADYTKHSQWKYWPAFEWSAAAGRFVYYDYDISRTDTHLGARPFSDYNRAKYAGTQFEEMYNQL